MPSARWPPRTPRLAWPKRTSIPASPSAPFSATWTPELSPLPSSSGFLGFVQPQFSWNLLNYGRLANNVHLQEAKTQELIAAYQNRVLVAAQEVQTSLRAFLDSQEQADALSGSAADAAAAAQIGEDLFNQVKADVNRLFILESTRLQTQDQLAVAQGNIALNLINVYRALGGGWQLRTQLEPHGDESDKSCQVRIDPKQFPVPPDGERPAAPVHAAAAAGAPPAELLPAPVVPAK